MSPEMKSITIISKLKMQLPVFSVASSIKFNYRLQQFNKNRFFLCDKCCHLNALSNLNDKTKKIIRISFLSNAFPEKLFFRRTELSVVVHEKLLVKTFLLQGN